MIDRSDVSVLLIEDDEQSIKITIDLLARSKTTKFHTDVVLTLSDAIEILKTNNTYDVIVLDLVLPNGEGVEVFKKVKSITDKPIVIISGYEDKAIECVKWGAQDYLVKPFYDARALSRAIRYAIERHNWEKKYTQIVESTHAAVYEVDFKNNRFTYINDVALRETGYTRKEILNMTPVDLLTEDSIERWLERLAKIQLGYKLDNIEEYQIKKKDGSLMWVLITADYKYDNEGFIVGASVVAIDITEKKEKENQIQAIYKTAPIAIGLLKDDRIIADINDRFCEMLGYRKEEVLNKNVEFIYPDRKEYERVGRIKYDTIKKEGIVTLETKFKKKNGGLIDILLTTANLDSTDPSRGVTFSALDITKTKEIEREIETELNKRLDSWKSEVGIDFQNLNRLDRVLSL